MPNSVKTKTCLKSQKFSKTERNARFCGSSLHARSNVRLGLSAIQERQQQPKPSDLCEESFALDPKHTKYHWDQKHHHKSNHSVRYEFVRQLDNQCLDGIAVVPIASSQVASGTQGQKLDGGSRRQKNDDSDQHSENSQSSPSPRRRNDVVRGRRLRLLHVAVLVADPVAEADSGSHGQDYRCVSASGTPFVEGRVENAQQQRNEYADSRRV